MAYEVCFHNGQYGTRVERKRSLHRAKWYAEQRWPEITGWNGPHEVGWVGYSQKAWIAEGIVEGLEVSIDEDARP